MEAELRPQVGRCPFDRHLSVHSYSLSIDHQRFSPSSASLDTFIARAKSCSIFFVHERFQYATKSLNLQCMLFHPNPTSSSLIGGLCKQPPPQRCARQPEWLVYTLHSCPPVSYLTTGKQKQKLSIHMPAAPPSALRSLLRKHLKTPTKKPTSTPTPTALNHRRPALPASQS